MQQIMSSRDTPSVRVMCCVYLFSWCFSHDVEHQGRLVAKMGKASAAAPKAAKPKASAEKPAKAAQAALKFANPSVSEEPATATSKMPPKPLQPAGETGTGAEVLQSTGTVVQECPGPATAPAASPMAMPLQPIGETPQPSPPVQQPLPLQPTAAGVTETGLPGQGDQRNSPDQKPLSLQPAGVTGEPGVVGPQQKLAEEPLPLQPAGEPTAAVDQETGPMRSKKVLVRILPWRCLCRLCSPQVWQSSQVRHLRQRSRKKRLCSSCCLCLPQLLSRVPLQSTSAWSLQLSQVSPVSKRHLCSPRPKSQVNRLSKRVAQVRSLSLFLSKKHLCSLEGKLSTKSLCNLRAAFTALAACSRRRCHRHRWDFS